MWSLGLTLAVFEVFFRRNAARANTKLLIGAECRVLDAAKHVTRTMPKVGKVPHTDQPQDISDAFFWVQSITVFWLHLYAFMAFWQAAHNTTEAALSSKGNCCWLGAVPSRQGQVTQLSAYVVKYHNLFIIDIF